MSPQPPPAVLSLADAAAARPAWTGGKAASLARLAQEGHPVPEGIVLTAPALSAWLAELPPEPSLEVLQGAPLPAPLQDAIDRFAASGGPVAVRSSGVAEDLADASFAGQYETVLEVLGAAAIEAAVRRCLASAFSERVAAYRAERGIASAPMAVLIQRMVAARSAGVAFTADPVTGERGVVTISAVGGLGERLVSGLADAEEWEVRGETVSRRRGVGAVLTASEAAQVAALAHRVGTDGPTDLEWAFDASGPRLLQARPMTALPDPVSWDCPAPGGYLRNFRLGEWLGAPMTPLTDTWLVTDLEHCLHTAFGDLFGIYPSGPVHVTVNGWYFYGGFNFDPSPWKMLALLPRMAWNALFHFRRMAAVFPPVAHLGFDAELDRWRRDLLPQWRADTAALEAAVDTADARTLRGLVQRSIDTAGQQLASIVGVAGYASKAEGALFTFWKAHLGQVDGAVHDVVVGAEVAPAAHDVEGLDWVFPTLGERGPLPVGPSSEARERTRLRREAVEARVAATLSPKLHRTFTALVAEARRAHVARLEQTGLFTLAWPAHRRALHRIGAELVGRGVLPDAGDVFFLTRDELDRALEGASERPPVAQRRATWNRQRRLAPPLVIGSVTGILKDLLGEFDSVLRTDEHDAPDALPGMPGSPGRVTGPARVVRSVDELHRLLPGEVLVAPVTTPGWTAAFSRALAVVTDTGSVASHASIVAREHGIPAVVGTGNGTARIVDGQRITVDGSRGVVRLGG